MLQAQAEESLPTVQSNTNIASTLRCQVFDIGDADFFHG